VNRAGQKSTDGRVGFEVGDAQRLRIPDATFDQAMSLLVINFIPDPVRALREMIRVTKPGGVVTAAVWDYGEGMQMLRVFWDEAIAFDRAIVSRDASTTDILVAPDSIAAAGIVAGLIRTGDVLLVKGSRGIAMERIIAGLA